MNELEQIAEYKIENAAISRFEAKGHIEAAKENDFSTNLGFLLAHNGLRRGKTHVIASPSSSGKTTLCKSIIADVLRCNPDTKVGLYLTEESALEAKIELSRTMIENGLERLFIFAEEDQGFSMSDPKAFLSALNKFISETNIDVLIIDNITTSDCYQDIPTRMQGELIKRIKKGFRHYNVAGIIFAHTNAEVSNFGHQLLKPNDVRGSKHIVNHAHFFYILQQYHLKGAMGQTKVFTFIRMHKHRGHSPEFKLYALVWDKEQMVYSKDFILTFDELKQFNEKREGI